MIRSRPHGHVAAVVGTARQVGLPALLAASRSRERDRVEALIAARLLDPCSKLATARALGAATEESSLCESLGVADADEDALYAAMDWLLTRQGRVEQALARRHLTDGGLILYDVTSTYFDPAARSAVKIYAFFCSQYSSRARCHSLLPWIRV